MIKKFLTMKKIYVYGNVAAVALPLLLMAHNMARTYGTCTEDNDTHIGIQMTNVLARVVADSALRNIPEES